MSSRYHLRARNHKRFMINAVETEECNAHNDSFTSDCSSDSSYCRIPVQKRVAKRKRPRTPVPTISRQALLSTYRGILANIHRWSQPASYQKTLNDEAGENSSDKESSTNFVMLDKPSYSDVNLNELVSAPSAEEDQTDGMDISLAEEDAVDTAKCSSYGSVQTLYSGMSGPDSTDAWDALSTLSQFSNLTSDYDSDGHERHLKRELGFRRRARPALRRKGARGRLPGLAGVRYYLPPDAAAKSRLVHTADPSWCQLRVLESVMFTMCGDSVAEHRSAVECMQVQYPDNMRLLWQVSLSMCRLFVVDNASLVERLTELFSRLIDVESGSALLSAVALLVAAGHWRRALAVCMRRVLRPTRLMRGALLFNRCLLETLSDVARLTATTSATCFERSNLLQVLSRRLQAARGGPLAPCLTPLSQSISRMMAQQQ